MYRSRIEQTPRTGMTDAGMETGGKSRREDRDVETGRAAKLPRQDSSCQDEAGDDDITVRNPLLASWA